MSSINAPQQWDAVHMASSAQSSMVGFDDQCYSLQRAPGFPAGIWMCDATAHQSPYPMQSSIGGRSVSGACAPGPMATPFQCFTPASFSSINFVPQAYGEDVANGLSVHTSPCQPTFNLMSSAYPQDLGFTANTCPSFSSEEMRRPFFLDLADHLNLENCKQSTSMGAEASASGLCTPEITPRHHAFEVMPKLETISTCMMPEIVSKLANAEAGEEDGAGAELGKHSVVDAFSECDSSDDEKDNVCWDFDIHSALLIRAQRDANSYASSETSTAVSCSRSSHRRRGRRAAKGKVRSTMAILETPPIEEVLVTEAMKVELIQQLEMGGEPMFTAVSNILGSALRMSLEPFGCRVIQSALDVAGMAEKEAIAAELQNNVRLVTTSPHANFVIQKVIEVLPVSSTTFVAEELLDIAADVAQHRFGCRVLSRLVEHHLCGDTASPATNALIDELLLETDLVIRHNFARHVLELVLEHGSEAHKHSIAETIQANVFYYAKNRCASYVLEKALGLCSGQDVGIIVSALFADPKQFLALALHECGMHVVRAAIRSSSKHAQMARDMLLEDVQHIKSSKYGKRLLDEIGHVEC